ncbi:MAG: translation initiation factor [Caldilineales bacterium]|nr:translation initiation factor [Caldilineales bacterium]
MPTPAQTEPIRVYLERKGRGGKSVSVIKGIQSHPDGKKSLLKHLQARLGTGGAVKEGDIEIQGDHRDRIIDLLAELGLKAKKAGG